MCVSTQQIPSLVCDAHGAWNLHPCQFRRSSICKDIHCGRGTDYCPCCLLVIMVQPLSWQTLHYYCTAGAADAGREAQEVLLSC